MASAAAARAPQHPTGPNYKQKVSVAAMRERIREVLDAQLQPDQTYQSEHTSTWTKDISDEVKARMRDLNVPRYKFMVQVVMGEQRGEGVRMGCRCFWDSNADNFASETFVNEHLFCVVSCWAVYLY